MPVQFIIVEDVSLGSACEPSCFGPVSRKLPPIKPIEDRDSPIRVLISLRRLGVDFHDLELGRGGLGSRRVIDLCCGSHRWALLCCRGVVNGRFVKVSGKYVWGDQSPC